MADLEALGGIIARAEAALAADTLVDISPLEGFIEDVCQRIEGLPAAEGRIVQPRLLALVDDFGRLGRSIEKKMAELNSQMGETTGRQRAVSAYTKTAKPGK